MRLTALIRLPLAVVLLLPALITSAAPMSVTDSKYYVIHSDLDTATVREAATRMACMGEEYYERTKGMATGQINRKFKFMLFGTRQGYRAAGGPDGSIGVFLGNLPDHPLAAIRLDDRPELLWHTIQHEGFHQFSCEVLGGGRQPLPIWLEEGLADYFGYAQFTGEDLVTGVIPPDRLAMVQQMMISGRFRPMSKLMSISHMGWNSVADGVDYLEVWSIVHYLVHAEDGKYRPAFERYIKDALKPNGPAISIHEYLGAGDEFEKNWREWWLSREPDCTKDLYARAAATALCSYMGRAAAQKQTFTDVAALLGALDKKQIKLSDADWLPPSLVDSIHRWISINGAGAQFELGKDPRTPQVTVRLSDGTRLTATYNSLVRIRRVSVITDALPAEIAKANALMAQSKHADARKLLQDALKKYPTSPQAAEARKLIQQTFALASATPVKPPVVVTPKPGPVAVATPRAVVNPNLPPLMVVSARYGSGEHWANITDPVREMVKNGVLALPQKLFIEVGVDPTPGFMKYIDLIVMIDGVPMRIFTAENEEADPLRVAAEPKIGR
jgi:hypothetical protein